jgi:hypothetical protein
MGQGCDSTIVILDGKTAVPGVETVDMSGDGIAAMNVRSIKRIEWVSIAPGSNAQAAGQW